MNSTIFVNDFAVLGKQLTAWLHDEHSCEKLTEAMRKSVENNDWFSVETIRQAISAIAYEMLDKQNLQQWLSRYSISQKSDRVGVVMAGNIPLVGFHDFLSVLAAGHFFVGKLSRKDKFLLPAITEILFSINSEWREFIHFADELPIDELDKLIATGSDATANYFQKISTKIKDKLIRHNRKSVAILSGEETKEELSGLVFDICSYFGLGCRNVSLLYVPADYDWNPLLTLLSEQKKMLQNNSYKHNYNYQKAILSMNKETFIDASALLLIENKGLQAPLSVLHYSYYNKKEDVLKLVSQQDEQLQCIVASNKISEKFCNFGKTQFPQLNDYADGVDTMRFLTTN